MICTEMVLFRIAMFALRLEDTATTATVVTKGRNTVEWLFEEGLAWNRSAPAKFEACEACPVPSCGEKNLNPTTIVGRNRSDTLPTVCNGR